PTRRASDLRHVHEVEGEPPLHVLHIEGEKLQGNAAGRGQARDEASSGSVVTLSEKEQGQHEKRIQDETGDGLQNDGVQRDPLRERRLSSMYTPRAARPSTVISPIVSNPRKSTRMTFTTL